MPKKIKRPTITESVKIPAELNVTLEKNQIIVKKDSKTITRIIDDCVNMVREGDNIVLSAEKARKSERRLLGTNRSHIQNMFDGLSNPWEYELEICNVHFPITVTFDKAKGEFIVKNLLGERSPRVIKARCPEKIEVEIKAPHIKIKSYDLEVAGQNAANLEKISRVRNRDRNKFQDGIFITKKPGKSFL